MARPARSSKDKTSAPVQKTLFDLFPSKRRDEAEQPGIRDAVDNPATEFPSIPATSASIGLSVLQPTSPGHTRVPSTKKQGTSNPKLYSIFEKPDATQKKIQISTHDLGGDVVEITDNGPAPGIPQVKPESVVLPRSGHSLDAPVLGTSPHDPIVLDSSPVQRPDRRHPLIFPQIPYPIFASAVQKDEISSSTSAIPRSKATKSVDAPFPDQDLQHVRGPQSSFSSPVLKFSRRASGKQTVSCTETSLADLALSDNEGSRPTTGRVLPTPTALDRQHYIDTIPSEHTSLHPAVARILGSSLPPTTSDLITTSSSQKTWADRWRPTRAEQVLGNERQALYLRDWLRALELEFVTSPLETSGPTQKTKGKSKGKSASLKAKEVRRDLKRPRIVRAVEKRRGRKKLRIESEEEDDWIVESDEFSDYDIADGDSDDDFRGEAGIQDQNETALDQPPDDVDSSYTAHDFRVKLTNTILIAGPPGCGKTAAVYACADELGWEVFEVYPGIGKRSASSLDNLVGDVGKNHLVRNAQQPARQDAFTVIQSMKGREKAGDEMPSKATGNEEKPIEIEDTEDRSRHGTGSTSVDDFGFIAVSDPTPSGVGLNEGQATAVVRQSMVLFEEVDILFKDDSTFWPAVISLIKDCKRPVIMTCNDLTLVPTGDLPLQNILRFECIPSPLAVSYLQSLCVAESQLIEQEYLGQLYDTTYELSAADLSVQNPSRDGLPVPDLRRAIHQLQFLCSSTAKQGTGGDVGWQTHSLEDMIDWTRLTEAEQQTRSGTYHSDLLSYVDSVAQHPLETAEVPLDCDELGHTMVSPETSVPLHRGDEIAHAILRLSREVFAPGPRSRRIANPANVFSRVSYRSQMAEVFRGNIPLTAVAPAVYLDYEPGIRWMVCIDDMYERNGGDVPRQWPGRMTRTRSKSEYVRGMSLSKAQREIIISTKLGVPI